GAVSATRRRCVVHRSDSVQSSSRASRFYALSFLCSDDWGGGCLRAFESRLDRRSPCLALCPVVVHSDRAAWFFRLDDRRWSGSRFLRAVQQQPVLHAVEADPGRAAVFGRLNDSTRHASHTLRTRFVLVLRAECCCLGQT